MTLFSRLRLWNFKGELCFLLWEICLYLTFLLLHRGPMVEQGLDPKIPSSR